MLALCCCLQLWRFHQFFQLVKSLQQLHSQIINHSLHIDTFKQSPINQASFHSLKQHCKQSIQQCSNTGDMLIVDVLKSVGAKGNCGTSGYHMS